jgi:hypothetical protein
MPQNPNNAIPLIPADLHKQIAAETNKIQNALLNKNLKGNEPEYMEIEINQNEGNFNVVDKQENEEMSIVIVKFLFNKFFIG